MLLIHVNKCKKMKTIHHKETKSLRLCKNIYNTNEVRWRHDLIMPFLFRASRVDHNPLRTLFIIDYYIKFCIFYVDFNILNNYKR